MSGRRWLGLARSYEFMEQLEFASTDKERNKKARLNKSQTMIG
jgi:hypothetical protein